MKNVLIRTAHSLSIDPVGVSTNIGAGIVFFDDEKSIANGFKIQKCSEVPFLPLLCHFSGKNRNFKIGLELYDR